MRISKKQLKRWEELAALSVNPLLNRSKELGKQLEEQQKTYDCTKEPMPQHIFNTFIDFACTNIEISQRGILKR